jgi:vacuole morphology and inheritance protein 14
LDPERIYCAIADILETDEDLEFASIMVQNLNIILVTAIELSDLRKRLRNLDNKENHRLFNVLYKSWCHNAVSAFSLCLLSQVYEHAANMLQVL